MSTSYIKIKIGNREVDTPSIEDLPVTISYKLEDQVDFQTKRNSSALNIKVPATLVNSQIFNAFNNPGAEDTTPGETYSSTRPVTIEAAGTELLSGKALLTAAEENSVPISFEFDCYGGNADWAIDLTESTLYDFVKHITYLLNKDVIVNSWSFDGTDENLPYVFAPVRYGQAMGVLDTDPASHTYNLYTDKDMKTDYIKPSISKYWILYWGFKSLGYRIVSNFFDTDYFRRQVMLWTWGNYLFSDGTRLDTLRFLARATQQFAYENINYEGYMNLYVTNDNNTGAYNNNGVYSYNATTNGMTWTYPPSINYGALDADMHLIMQLDTVSGLGLPLSAPYVGFYGSIINVKLRWFKKAALTGVTTMEYEETLSTGLFSGEIERWYVAQGVLPGDQIICMVYLHQICYGLGPDGVISNPGHTRGNIDTYECDYLRVSFGTGTVDFSNILGFKKHKFLDFVRGVVDEFNLSVQTDAFSKVVYFEPTHPYSLTNDLSATNPGHFSGNTYDWESKRDLIKASKQQLFQDSERELIFKFKDDTNDGILKLIQDRNQCTLAASKYLLPERYKEGQKQVENRFFSPVMHYDVEQWKYIKGVAPQMICMIPENISNTSREEAQNTFAPKSAYYKGTTTDYGWTFDGENTHPYPFMFAVNYKEGGENDPILSYTDEAIGGTPVIGKGLLRRFYLQRMAIMREGRYYTTFFQLNNKDVGNWQHREHIICKGQRWELVEITGYRPLKNESAQCFMRKWTPVIAKDGLNVFPATTTISTGTVSSNKFDTKYAALKCLLSDIPT